MSEENKLSSRHEHPEEVLRELQRRGFIILNEHKQLVFTDKGKLKAEVLYNTYGYKSRLALESLNGNDEMLTKRIYDLHLLVLFLSGREEDSRENPGEKVFLSWKDYPDWLIKELVSLEIIEKIIKNRKILVFNENGISWAKRAAALYAFYTKPDFSKNRSLNTA